MRAARIYGNKDLRVEEIPKPVRKDGQVLIDIEWCGICGSDLHEWAHGPSVMPKAPNAHPISGEVMPITMGHEFCGRIVETGPNSSLKVGQAVVADPRLYCSSCHRCDSSATNACLSWGFRGISGGGGGLSETVAIDEKQIYVLPDNADLSIAALVEPLTVAWHAIKQTGTSDFGAKSVLILGGGPVGLAVAVVLRTKGAKKIFVSEPTAKRIKQNEEIADKVIDPTKEKVGDRCRELTGGRGVDIVFDCAGNEFAMKDGMDALKHNGFYMNVAGWVKPFIIPQGHFMMKEITISCSFSYTDEDFRETVDAFTAGAFPGIEKFVTGRITLEDVVEKGFTQLIENTADHVKIMVSPKLA